MQRVLVLFIAGVVCLLPLGAQSNQKSLPPSPIPESVLFRFFFLHVGFLERVADSEAAAGRNSSKARGEIQRQARLSEQEAVTIKAVALSCNQRDKTYLGQVAPQVDALKARMEQVPQERAQVERQLKALDDDRERIMTNCVDLLRTQLGQGRFQQLRVFAMATVGSKIRVFTTAQKGKGVQ